MNVRVPVLSFAIEGKLPAYAGYSAVVSGSSSTRT